MAVETRYVVVRGGNEIMTFADKKAADEYDRMLDMADNLTALFDESSIDMTDKLKEDLGIYLAKNRDEVLYALLAKKRPTPAKPQAANDEVTEEEPEVKTVKKPAARKRKAQANE